ncbi:MAG: hypothetical protein HDR02_06770 [Lachnospiraceae bacterium]|nr:hypothetical protein [Lachnospiraceae bacterium]
MRIDMTDSAIAGTVSRTKRFSGVRSAHRKDSLGQTQPDGNMFQEWLREETEKKEGLSDDETVVKTPADRIEAAKVCETALNGGGQILNSIRTVPKVPYGYLAKDGVINYNGVVFTCDEKTNSICLGDMTDKKQVLNIPLSGGGHLKVNRKNLGQLSKAIGMFSPEDINLIMRAIHLDTKVQSVQKEVDDLEAGVGEQIADGGSTETDNKMEE